MSATMDELIDALAINIVGCQGRTNRDRALAVLAVIDGLGWVVVPRTPTVEKLEILRKQGGIAGYDAFIAATALPKEEA